MSTYIDGIGASQHIDSSGEIVDIVGMDISQLPIDGVLNYEHDQATGPDGVQMTIKRPENTVGKILYAKKIFSEQDCEDERQMYFWQKCLTPYVYVMGELFDDYKESAKEVAGMFRYDLDRKGQNERNVMNFSIEGGKIEKKGNIISKSIARKVTICVLPCNKMAIAEIVPAQGKKQKDDLDGLFRSESSIEIELIKNEDLQKMFEGLKKSVPHLKLATPQDPRGTNIGKTKGGKDIFSHEKVHNYQGFGSQDHKDAANAHYGAIKSGSDPKTNQHHMGKMKLHMQASYSAERREQRYANSTTSARANAASAKPAPKIQASVHRPYGQVGDIKKASTAGSGNAAPGQLTGGAAKTPQSFDKKLHKTGERGVHTAGTTPSEKGHNPGVSRMGRAVRAGDTKTAKIDVKNTTHFSKQIKPNLTKSEYWLERAEQEYAQWNKKEQFIEFMAEKYPLMTKTEIDVIGATLALKKSIENEDKLENLSKVLKFGDGNYTPKAGSADATPKSKVPEHHKGTAPDVKGKTLTEVEHVEPHYTGKHDAVYLKSGHRSEHQPTGKYKAGDKVTIKAHIQGTHVLHHGHDDE